MSHLPPLNVPKQSCSTKSSYITDDVLKLYRPHGKYAGLRPIFETGKPFLLERSDRSSCCLRKAVIGGERVTLLSKIYNTLEGSLAELYLYADPRRLRPLQGVYVPYLVSAFETPDGLPCMAMELPHPFAWRTASSALSRRDKKSIVNAYAAIHAQGVLHGYVSLDHMLVGDDGRVTVINFRRASSSSAIPSIGLAACKEHEFDLEMRHVKFLLDFDNARAKEYFNAKENTIHHSSSLPVDHKNYMISERTLRLWEEQAQYDESWVDVPTAFIQSKDCTTSEDIAEEEEVEAMLGHLPSTRLSPALSPLHINFDKRDTRVRQSKPESASSTTPRKRRHTGDHHTSTDSPRMKKRVRFHPVDVEIVVPNYQPGRRASSTFPDENSPIRMRRPSRRVEPDFLNESSSCSRTPSPVPSSITSNMFANVLPSLPHGAHELLAFWSPLSSPSAYAAFARAFSPLAFLPTESISSNEEVPVLQQVGTGRGSSRARSVMPSLSSGSDSSSDDDLATPVDSRSSLHHIHSGSPGHEGLPHDGDELVLINEEAHNSADMTTLEAIHTTAGAAREPHRKIGWRPNKRKANPTDDWEVSLDDRPRQRHRGLPLRT